MRSDPGWIAKRNIFRVLLLSAFLPNAAWAADDSHADLAKQTQNPVSDLISVPFQNNTNFGLGPHDRTQNVLNIQPVIPVQISENWNIINGAQPFNVGVQGYWNAERPTGGPETTSRVNVQLLFPK
jgi:hypothetical protein